MNMATLIKYAVEPDEEVAARVEEIEDELELAEIHERVWNRAPRLCGRTRYEGEVRL